MDRYEEALEKARAEYEKASKQGYTWLMGLLEGMFPVLKDSEDERVRQAIIAVVEWAECFNSSSVTHEDAETMLAYLEKQKDLDEMIVVSPEVWDKAIADAYENGKKDGEKRKELPTNEEMLRTLRVEYEKGVADTIAKYEQKEQDKCPEYCVRSHCMGCPIYEKQKENPDRAILIGKAKSEKQVVLLAESNGDENIYWDTKSEEDAVSLLEKGLKFFEKQKPADWSEEDEEMRGTCIDLLEHFPRPCGEVIGPWKDCIAWLKSLKNRGNSPKSNTNSLHWKPSKEQMKEYAYWYKNFIESGLASPSSKAVTVLGELLEQLEKL